MIQNWPNYQDVTADYYRITHNLPPDMVCQSVSASEVYIICDQLLALLVYIYARKGSH